MAQSWPVTPFEVLTKPVGIITVILLYLSTFPAIQDGELHILNTPYLNATHRVYVATSSATHLLENVSWEGHNSQLRKTDIMTSMKRNITLFAHMPKSGGTKLCEMYKAEFSQSEEKKKQLKAYMKSQKRIRSFHMQHR